MEYNESQAAYVEQLGTLQKELENYESTWKILRKKMLEISNLERSAIEEPKSSISAGSSSFGLTSFFMGKPKEKQVGGPNSQIIAQEAKAKLLEEIQMHKPLGLYAWGGPGCGKTFLMDLLYDSLDTPHKQRMHFNEFMLRVHHANFRHSSVDSIN